MKIILFTKTRAHSIREKIHQGKRLKGVKTFLIYFNFLLILNRNRDKNKALILNSSKIICYKTIRIPKCTFGRMALFNNNTEIISADGINNRLNICDINGNLINSFNPDGILQQPMSICVNDTDCENIEIYVGDYVTHKIIVFNSNFKYLGEFGNETLNVPEFIAIDKENFENLIYISDYRSNSITVWNSKRCEMTDVVEIDSPYTIKVFDEKLFVVSPAQFEVLDNSDKNTLKFKKITKGNNCVFILDKKSLRILDTIKLDNWLNPSSLHIDSKLNIYTVAYEINKPSGLLSKFKSLYIVDKNGILVKKFELEDIQITADMIVLDSELIFSVNNEIKIIQFK